ncbi:MAG: hypothetical protein HEP71_22830 [Roseivirga sp.]|nr:hypothetical protein [Roseivirga sp.]
MLLKNTSRQLSNEEAAVQIGNHFPEVSDKLLNIIQLEQLTDRQNELLMASIRQKSQEISKVPFVSAIDYSKNRKYFRYAIVPASIIVLLLVFIPKFITDSSARIINYNTDFIPEAPFSISLQNEKLLAFKGESYTLKINTEGRSAPANLYVWSNNRKVKAQKVGPGSFEYIFNRLQSDTEFKLEAESIFSIDYEIQVVSRPSLSLFNLELDFPRYLNREPETIENSGNVSIPEGTNVKWSFTTESAETVTMNFSKLGEQVNAQKTGTSSFSFEKGFKLSTPYSIQLENEYSTNRDSLQFGIETIKDRYPEITLEQYQDTVLFQNLVLAGNISDDYGFARLAFHYKYESEDEYTIVPFEINRNLSSQSYYQVFNLDSARVKAGSELSYYLQVSDNDGVNGSKSSKTGTYSFKIPSQKEIEEDLEKSSQQVQDEIDKTLQEAKELNEKIAEADERLKTKKQMDWQDEKLMQDIIKQKEELAEKIEELKKENQLNNLKREQFTPQDESVKKKMEQLQELMENILDEETKKLYDELKQLLEEQADMSEFRDKMEELKGKEEDLEQELERTLELFKKMQFDMKLEENIQDLQQQIEDQEKLNEETGDRKNDTEELSEKQEEEKNDTEDLEEQLEKLNELNQKRENPDALPEDMQEQLEQIKQEQQNAQEQLENKKRKKAGQSQQKATQQMKKLQKSLQAMQNSMGMEQQQEDLSFLKDLVDNLVTLSFNQEDLMNEFKEIRQSDPRFVELSQRQLKLKDDSKITQDSLVSLSKRVFQISSFVMRELNEMNRQMDGALDALKEKRLNQATGKQQFTMTSINNLALLLDDVLQQMQEQMAQQMGMGQKGKGKNKPMPGGLSDLQKQLSQQIQQLKKSGKSGRALSEELARLAAQQERLRNALQEMETGLDGGKNLGDKIDKLIDQMEKNEEDLINKNITDETVERQQEILTRLLEAESAVKERGQEEERKAATAYDYELSVPESINEYLKAKEKEIELLKTIPAKLNPYYKKETNKYFKKIKQQN